MNIRSAKLAYFSPTGTTRSIADAVARGIGVDAVERIDVTKPEARKKPLHASCGELLVVGVPVYVGRVPELLGNWLRGIRADKTPVVCIVVYGNRAYEDALLELRDVMAQQGGIPIAGAAFIGEHSFSSSGVPIAMARPDTGDLERAEAFGREIGETLRSMASPEQISSLSVPGNHPYREQEALLSVDFIAVEDACVTCGTCAEGCPVEAIDLNDHSRTDRDKCILCCACIKSCPQHARSMLDGPVKDIAQLLSETCRERKEPELFLAKPQTSQPMRV